MTTPYIIYLIVCGIYGLTTEYKPNQFKFWLGIVLIIAAYECGKENK